MIINEFKSRKNVHQTHTEDLVLLGQEGLEELNDKISKLINQIKGTSSELNVTMKVDGCLHKDTLVKTTEGDISIAKLIRDWPTKKYIGYGRSKDTDEPVEIELSLPRSCYGDKEWYDLGLENGSHIIATENHLFRINGSYKAVDDIQVNDNIEEL